MLSYKPTLLCIKTSCNLFHQYHMKILCIKHAVSHKIKNNLFDSLSTESSKFFFIISKNSMQDRKEKIHLYN